MAADTRPRVLSIGAVDPSAETGVLADVRTLLDNGCEPATVLTAIATGVRGEKGVIPVSSQVVVDQLDGLKGKEMQAMKLGMVADEATIDVVAARARGTGVPLVADPEMELLRTSVTRQWLRAYRGAILPLSTVLVVDAGEGRLLAQTNAAAHDLVRALLGLGPKWVILKAFATDNDDHEDVISDGAHWYAVRSRAVAVAARGTGDVFSAAITAGIARGEEVPKAASAAREHVVARLEGLASAARG